MFQAPHGFDGFWWRCETKSYGSFDEWGDYVGSYTQVQWTKFGVIKTTPKGVFLVQTTIGATDPDKWLNHKPGDFIFQPTFVLGRAIRQYAAPTKELAWEDARQRKLRHISGCKARLASAERDLHHLEMSKPRTETPVSLS